MVTRTKIIEAGRAHQFEAYDYTGDDGYPTSKVFSPVYVKTFDGKNYYLSMGKKVMGEEGIGYIARYIADEMLSRVQADGSIDTTLWVEIVEDSETFEERFAPFGSEWLREQENR